MDAKQQLKDFSAWWGQGLLLPPDKHLQKPLTYPLSSEKELRAILVFEMDKQTPFAHDNVYFDYVITQRDTSNNRLHVILYVVLRDLLRKHLDVLKFLDLQPATATTGLSEMIENVNFIPASDTKLNGKSDRHLSHLALFTFILFMVSLYMPLLRQGAIIEQFERQVQQSRTQATEAQVLVNKKQSILEKELAALSGLEIDQTGFLGQKSRDLAAADLQRLLGLLIDETGATLVSTQVLPGTDDESVFPEITIKVYMRGAIESFRQLLYRFDSGQPLLFVDNLLVQKRQRGDERARRDAGQLDIRFDVSAFIYQATPDTL